MTQDKQKIQYASFIKDDMYLYISHKTSVYLNSYIMKNLLTVMQAFKE